MIEQAVTFAIEAAHLSEGDARLNGHSYVVEVWTAALRDFVALEKEVQVVRSAVDHTLLNDSIGGTTIGLDGFSGNGGHLVAIGKLHS